MSDSKQHCRFLVSVQLPDPYEPNTELLGLMEGSEVHLLASYLVSDQTSPEQARDEFEEDAHETLEEYKKKFAETGQIVQTSLVFTPKLSETLDRIEEEVEFDAVLVPGAMETLGRVVVALTGDVDFDRVVHCCGAIFEGEDLEILLVNVTDDEEEVDEKELVLRGIRDRLEEFGVDPERIEVESVSSVDPAHAIKNYVEAADIAVLAEKEKTVREKLFSEAWDLVTDEHDLPVFVVKLDD